MKKFGCVFALAIVVSACAATPSKHEAVRGSATFSEQVELPAGASFEAVLEDVSRADVAATPVGNSRLDPAGDPPFRFEIDYDRKVIDPSHRYAVRARVTDNGRVIFTSDTVYPVLTGGAGDKIEIVLRPVSASVDSSPSAEFAPFPAVFEGTLPCADCAGIHYRLTLAQEGTYTLHQRYEGRSADRNENGVWVYMQTLGRIELQASNGASELFHVASIDRLEKLDQSGQPIDSKLDYALLRQTGTE